MPFIESQEEFAARHGNRAVQIGNQCLFGDGAVWIGVPENRGIEPPEPGSDEHHRRILLYEKQVLKDLENRFRDLHKFLVQQSQFFEMGAGPAPPTQAFADLRQLQHEVEAQRDKIEELADDSPQSGPSPNEIVRAEQRSRAAQLLSELRKIEI